MTVIDDYFANVAAPQKAALEHIRKLIKTTVPSAEEVITYGMPGFKYKGKYLIAFAPFKDHMSIFPGSDPMPELAERLASFKRSKGTIQFTLDNQIPDDVLEHIVANCVARIDG